MSDSRRTSRSARPRPGGAGAASGGRSDSHSAADGRSAARRVEEDSAAAGRAQRRTDAGAAASAPGGAGPGAGSDWERLRAGWAGDRPPAGPGLGSLFLLLDAARGLVPGELERQFTALLRELLLTLRAVIDWYLERLDGGTGERRVEDIPIE